jgi:hypothetical protein
MRSNTGYNERHFMYERVFNKREGHIGKRSEPSGTLYWIGLRWLKA